MVCHRTASPSLNRVTFLRRNLRRNAVWLINPVAMTVDYFVRKFTDRTKAMVYMVGQDIVYDCKRRELGLGELSIREEAREKARAGGSSF